MQLAFHESKARAFQRMRDPRSISLAWVRESIEEQERLLGPDRWAYTYTDNVTVLETMIRYSHEQGIISRPMRPEALFVPSTLEELPGYHG
jgi:4,5-dihydroxyphthalate decarboxylase